MGDYAINQLVEAAVADLLAAAHRRFDATEGTPIERIFETGLHLFYGVSRVQGVRATFQRANFALEEMPPRGDLYRSADIWYWTQYPVLDWKVDFVLGKRGADNSAHFVVVECDGHDFHERTKEQAAKDRSRDRRLQDAGFRIHRYTGHELYKQPYDCVSQALTALIEQSQGRSSSKTEETR